MEFFIIFIGGIIGIIGFALMFQVSHRQIFWAILGGALTFIFYLVSKPFGIFISNVVAGFVMMVYCEIIARYRKAPVTVFLSTALIILVPGGALYYTISNVLSKNTAGIIDYGLSTAATCLGIMAGISVATVLINTVFYFLAKRKKNKTEDNI